MKQLQLPKKLTLDCSKWVCGPKSILRNLHNSLGEGASRLLNYNEYQCCLGQFSEQCGVPHDELKNLATPISLARKNHYYVSGLALSTGHNTDLAEEAMEINDGLMTIQEKVDSLYKLFRQYDYTISFINLPEGIHSPNPQDAQD